MAIRMGSWGLPEFGLTEKISGFLGQGKTAQGGSNLLGGGLPTAINPKGQPIQGPGLGWDVGQAPIPQYKAPVQTGGGTSQPTQPTQPAQAPSGGGGPDFGGMQNNAQDQSQIELEQALSEYDRQAEGLQAQSGQLDTQRAGALSTIDTSQTNAQTEATKAKEEATLGTQQAKSKALSTAQDVQKSNRNVLRALGILQSSAGGEILSKPMTEYGKQSAELEQGLVKRIGVVEDWLMGRQKEFDVAKKDIETQYMQLKDNISRDLRFNERQRLTAIKAAQGALQQRMQEIQNQSLSYQNTAKQYSDNILLQIAQMKMYQNPTVDVSSIYNMLLSGAQGTKQPQQVATTLSEEQRKKQLGTLSGLG